MKRNRVVAVLLALFLGYFGVHKFYLGQNTAGIVRLLLCAISLTVISTILGFIDFLRLAMMSDRDFDQKYNQLSFADSAYSSKPTIQLNSSHDKIQSLEGLKKLYDQGIITADEYEEKRRKFLDSL